MPVWEEQQLGNYSHGYPPHMPFQSPLRAASHSALYLSVDAGGDQLVGRADNGDFASSPIQLEIIWSSLDCCTSRFCIFSNEIAACMCMQAKSASGI